MVKLLIRPAPPTGPGPVTTSGQVATRHEASHSGGHTRGHQPQPSTFRLRWRSSQSYRRQPTTLASPRSVLLRTGQSSLVRRQTIGAGCRYTPKVATWALPWPSGGEEHGGGPDQNVGGAMPGRRTYARAVVTSARLAAVGVSPGLSAAVARADDSAVTSSFATTASTPQVASLPAESDGAVATTTMVKLPSPTS